MKYIFYALFSMILFTFDDNSLYIYRLSTVGMLGENSAGMWSIEIADKNSLTNQNNREIKAVKLEILGY